MSFVLSGVTVLTVDDLVRIDVISIVKSTGFVNKFNCNSKTGVSSCFVCSTSVFNITFSPFDDGEIIAFTGV